MRQVKNKARIYVCCPVRPKAKDPEKAMQELKANLDRAERACELIMAAGGIPLCSPLYCIYGLNLDEQNPDDRALGLEIGMDMLRNADEVNVFSEHISEGMAAEIQLASQLGIPVRMLCEEPGFMLRMEKAGLEIVAHVHDEVIIESPIGAHTVDEICDLMSVNPSWAEGLPLAADGYKGNFYFKS